jgi:LPXTG-motif cell wall-anchored protein
MAQVSGTRRGKNLRSTSPPKTTAVAVALLVAILGGLFVSFASSAQAASTATPITDYLHYPVLTPALLPDTCTSDGTVTGTPISGPAVLQGISYVVKHNGVNSAPSSDLSSFSLVIGDQVTMSWADYTKGCEHIGISLALKATQHPIFVPQDDQSLVSFAYCSESDCGTATAFGHLTVTIPNRETACNFQLDAVIGPPLAKVGPNGSYYNNETRGANGKPHGTATDLNMLIGANNGGEGKCIIPPTATASLSCAAEGGPGADVVVSNPDDDDTALVNVYKNGTVVNTSPVSISPLGSTTVKVPFTANETATVSVNDTVGGTLTPGNVIFTQAFTADCVHPSATITHSCAAGGTNVDFTNAGPAAALMTVSKNGVVIDTVTVPGNGTAHRTYPMAEDETSTFRVTGLGFDSGDFVGLHDCILAESTTTLPGSTTLPDSTSVPDTVEGSNVARAATLPRTGPPSTMQLSTMAGLMLMVGGLLVALANKPAPTAATASTRSRGR